MWNLWLNLFIAVIFIIFAIVTFYDHRLTTRQRNINAGANLLFAFGILLSIVPGILSYIGNGIVLIIFLLSCWQWFQHRS